MINPTLSIIIVSYNTSAITIGCLKSILKDKGLDLGNSPKDSNSAPTEIIVVDNDSKDGSPLAIEKFFVKNNLPKKNYTIIQNTKNLGFGKANNQGLAIAKGNYILFLNSDVIILHFAISQSLNWLSTHPECSTCTAQLLNNDRTIQASGGYFPNLINLFTWSTSLDDLPVVNHLIPPIHPHTPSFYTHDKFYTTNRSLDWVTGAFFLTRKNILDKVKGFDENYFMYGEELEMCYRIKKIYPSSQTWYLIGPQVIHLGGASSINKAEPLIKEYIGILSFFKKHRSIWQYPLANLLIKANARIHQLLYTIKGDKPRQLLYQQVCQKI